MVLNQRHWQSPDKRVCIVDNLFQQNGQHGQLVDGTLALSLYDTTVCWLAAVTQMRARAPNVDKQLLSHVIIIRF